MIPTPTPTYLALGADNQVRRFINTHLHYIYSPRNTARLRACIALTVCVSEEGGGGRPGVGETCPGAKLTRGPMPTAGYGHVGSWTQRVLTISTHTGHGHVGSWTRWVVDVSSHGYSGSNSIQFNSNYCATKEMKRKILKYRWCCK